MKYISFSQGIECLWLGKSRSLGSWGIMVMMIMVASPRLMRPNRWL